MEGLTLKVWRIQSGLTQYQLGQKFGIHPARISEMERNQRPVSADLAKVVEDSLSLNSPTVAN